MLFVLLIGAVAWPDVSPPSKPGGVKCLAVGDFLYGALFSTIFMIMIFFWGIYYKRLSSFRDQLVSKAGKFRDSYPVLNAGVAGLLASTSNAQAILSILNRCSINIRLSKRIADQLLSDYDSERKMLRMLGEFIIIQMLAVFYFVPLTLNYIESENLYQYSGWVYIIDMLIIVVFSIYLLSRYLGNLDRINYTLGKIDEVRQLVEESIQQKKCDERLDNVNIIDLLVVQTAPSSKNNE